MKKLISIILLSITLTGYAQRNSGIKLGSNISWISTTLTSNPEFNNNYNLTPLYSINIGYSWNIKVVKQFSIQADLLYNSKGGTAKPINELARIIDSLGSANVIDVAAKELGKRNYISIPITLNYMFNPHIFAEVGFETSYDLSGYSNSAVPLDFGLILGGGYSTKYVDFTMRYIQGLTNINPNSGSTDQNRVIQIDLTVPIFKYLKRS